MAEVDASTVSYVETHGTGTPLGDPIEIEGLRQAFAVSDERPSGSVLCRFGQVQHRPPGVCGRDRQPDQGDSVPQAPGNPGDAALHQPQPGIAPRPGTVRRAQRVRPVGMGRRSARRRQLVRCRWHQRACGARRGADGAGVNAPARPAGAVDVGSKHRGAAAVTLGPGRRIVRPRRDQPARRRVHPRRAAAKRTSGWRRSSKTSRTRLRCWRLPSTTTCSSANPRRDEQR